jgi:hypothetical protein
MLSGITNEHSPSLHHFPKEVFPLHAGTTSSSTFRTRFTRPPERSL